MLVRVVLVVGVERLERGLGVLQVAQRGGVIRLLPVGRKLGDGDGRQDADDRDNDQELNEGKTFSVFESV